MSEVRLHVEGAGAQTGVPLLLLNGARCTTKSWTPVLPALVAAGFNPLLHDVRGTGQSGPGPDEDYRLDVYADDAIRLLDQTRGPAARALVWGMAFGSRVGLTLAARHPDRVIGAALFDASVDLPDLEAQRAGAELAKRRRAEVGWPETAKDEAWHLMADPAEAMKAFGAARTAGRLDHLLPRVRGPVLIATGEHDPNLSSSRVMAERLADCELVVLERTGHGSVLQRPDHCVGVFLEWARRCCAS